MKSILVLMLSTAPTFAAEKPIAYQDWWKVCGEHGRHLRAKATTKRAQEVAYGAKLHGFAEGDEHAVLTREPRLGMTPCAAVAAYGRPDADNVSVGAWGTDQQYVYRARRLYLYFRDGKLTSYQER